MNFTRIEYFLAAAKCLNFTKAANVLYISQPSLSKQIALLEDELDIPLFDRSSRILRLTPAGKQLFNEFSRLMPEIDSITEKVKRMKEDCKETLAIGCIESIHLGETGSKAIQEFLSKANKVETFIERHGFETLHSKILDESLDVAFTISSQIGKMKDIEFVPIEERRRSYIMSTNHRLASQDKIEIEDLRGETFVIHSRSSFHYLVSDITEACEKAGFTPKIIYAPNTDTILDYIELTGCIGFFDKSITETRVGRLKHIPTEIEIKFDLICIWKSCNKNPALRKFIKCLPQSK